VTGYLSVILAPLGTVFGYFGLKNLATLGGGSGGGAALFESPRAALLPHVGAMVVASLSPRR